MVLRSGDAQALSRADCCYVPYNNTPFRRHGLGFLGVHLFALGEEYQKKKHHKGQIVEADDAEKDPGKEIFGI